LFYSNCLLPFPLPPHLQLLSLLLLFLLPHYLLLRLSLFLQPFPLLLEILRLPPPKIAKDLYQNGNIGIIITLFSLFRFFLRPNSSNSSSSSSLCIYST
jgi:hypothetical protein